jgi:hypothetical protein
LEQPVRSLQSQGVIFPALDQADVEIPQQPLDDGVSRQPLRPGDLLRVQEFPLSRRRWTSMAPSLPKFAFTIF